MKLGNRGGGFLVYVKKAKKNALVVYDGGFSQSSSRWPDDYFDDVLFFNVHRVYIYGFDFDNKYWTVYTEM